MEGLSKEYSIDRMDQLATAPIGKQQMIDMNAGIIIRREKKKRAKVFGLNPFFLLSFIMILKCCLIGLWLYREYDTSFDFGCQLLRGDQDKFKWNNDESKKRKRDMELDEFIKKQMEKKTKDRPVLGSSKGALTTMVTMTNLQDLPSFNSSVPIRMKTIRHRVEEINRVPQDEVFELSVESEEPTIYISPIQSRNAPPIDDDMMATVVTKTPKKKNKRKGKKKKTTFVPTTTTTTEVSVTKKKKGLGRKKMKMLMELERNRVATEQTKSPRHLMVAVGNTQATTDGPGRPSFVDGGVEPKETNKGHIRTYPMSKATKKPKNGIKLSEETKLMWQMDELNYTTHSMQVKTTEMTKQEKGMASFIDSLPAPKPKEKTKLLSTTPQPRHEFYASKANIWSKNKEIDQTTSPQPPVVALRPENKIQPERDYSFPTQTYSPVAIYYETEISPPIKPLDSTLAQLEREKNYNGHSYHNEEDSKEYYIPPSPRKVKHGFDRSLDNAIDAGLNVLSKETTLPKQKEMEDEDFTNKFQNELQSFTTNAMCIIRTFFDVWCVGQLITSIPYFLGICFPRKNLFVLHMILDIFFLGGGFLFSVTILGLSILLFVGVEGMSTAEFLSWLMFVFIIEAFLIAYTLIVYICYQCTERIIRGRWMSKTTPESV